MATQSNLDSDHPSCPICQSESRKLFTSKHDYLILKCQSSRCGHLFVGHDIPSQPEPEPVEIDDVAFNQIPEIYVRRNEQVIDYWQQQQFIAETGSFLDFGCGVGHISKSLRQRYPELKISCIEIRKDCLKHLTNCGFTVANNLDSLEGKFDAILLLEVIEHIADPINLLRQLRSRLTEKGTLFLTTPCGQLKSGTIKLEAHEDPTHIHFFTEKSLCLATEQAGFPPIQLRLVEALYPWSIQTESLSPVQQLQRSLRRILYPLVAYTRGYAHLTGFLHHP